MELILYYIFAVYILRDIIILSAYLVNVTLTFNLLFGGNRNTSSLSYQPLFKMALKIDSEEISKFKCGKIPHKIRLPVHGMDFLR